MSKKRCFFLKGFNSEDVDKKYGLYIISNIEKEIPDTKNKTDIFDVLEKHEENSISFLINDDRLSTMKNWLNIEQKTNCLCFWCKHSFKTFPIGCPIKYINNRIEKYYISQITKDKYYMKENITKNKLEKILQIKQDNITVTSVESDYYLTDGIFCSFNCILAFINDQSFDNFYSESKMLLHTMYKTIVGKEIKKITPAPHWRLLKVFGGTFSIEEFRDCFNLVEFENYNSRVISQILKKK
jgi:hypothetical protein